MISKCALEHSIPIRLKNIEISKALNVDRILVAHWIKFHQLSNVLRDPEDENETTQALL